MGIVKLAEPWLDPAWTRRRRLVVHHEYVPATLTGFPVYLPGSLLEADFYALCQAAGQDIVITDTSHNQIARNLAAYDPVTAAFELHFPAASLSHTVDTEFFLYYGNAVCGDQENAAAVWPTSHKMVLHLQEAAAGTGTPDLYQDASGNSNHGDDHVVETGKTGKLFPLGGQNFSQYHPDYDYIPIGGAVSSLSPTGAFMISAWVYLAPAVSWGTILSNCYQYWNDGYYFCIHYGKLTLARTWAEGGMDWVGGGPGGSAPNVSPGAWHYCSAAFDGAGNYRLRVDGTVYAATQHANVTIYRPDRAAQAGRCGGGPNPFDGQIDELRFVSGDLGADWDATVFANQNAPETFITVGAERTAPDYAGRTRYWMFHTAFPPTGEPMDADATPTAAVYEDDTDTAILEPVVTKVADQTGIYRIAIDVMTANGFEIGRSYNVHVAAQVAGISTDAVLDTFILEAYDCTDLNRDIPRLMGLKHENFLLDNPVRDSLNRLTAARLRTYTAAGSVGSDSNVLEEYNVTVTYPETPVTDVPETYAARRY